MLNWLLAEETAFPDPVAHQDTWWQGAIEIGRLVNAGLAVMAIAGILVCIWGVGLSVGERFHWQAVIALATTAAYGSIETYLTNTPGGARTAFLTVALVFLLVSVYHYWKSPYRRRMKLNSSTSK